MELAEDIRQAIESSSDKDVILEVITQLQADGVKITRDVVTAIETTLHMTEGVIE